MTTVDGAEPVRITNARRVSPGRPRDPEAESRVVRAALEEYVARGLAGVTMDGVARRAGVGKSTLYLRWSTKEALLVDAVIAYSQGIEAAETGSLRDDLILIARNYLTYLLDPLGFATFRIAVEAAADPREGRMSPYAERHWTAVAALFERAAANDISFDENQARFIAECLFGAITMKVMTRVVDDSFSEAAISDLCSDLVENLLSAATRSSAE